MGQPPPGSDGLATEDLDDGGTGPGHASEDANANTGNTGSGLATEDADGGGTGQGHAPRSGPPQTEHRNAATVVMRGPAHHDAGVETDAAAPSIARPAFAPGVLVGERYRLEQRLGAGGMGTVWRCRDEKLGVVVAIKLVGGAGGDPARDERWRREVATARRIADRNVCRVHDLGEAPGVRYVTMELVEGTPLRSLIGRLSFAHARGLFEQIVSGVAAIHAAGVVHRDVKPENVVVASPTSGPQAQRGRAVIVDFGIARDDDLGAAATIASPGAASHGSGGSSVTEHGTVLGTPRYMSPEQAAGEAVDARADVWALGLVGHELLAGAVPEQAPDGPLIAPAIALAWPEGAAVLRRCLARPASQRYADARGIQAALAPPVRSKKALAIGVAAVALAAGAGVTAVALRAASGSEPYRMSQVTTTSDSAWPLGAPVSVAVSRDGARFAFTTAEGKLFVRELDGGDATAWDLPKAPLREGSRDEPTALLVTANVVGWFADGSLAITGATRRGQWQLLRLWRDGRHEQLHARGRRFAAAVHPTDDRVAIGHDERIQILDGMRKGAAGDRLATGARVVALAWSPDGDHLAFAAHGDDGLVIGLHGEGDALLSAPSVAAPTALLAWVDDRRLAVAQRDPDGRTRLMTVPISGGAPAIAEELDDLIVGGSAARGTVLVVRGPTREGIAIGDRWLGKLSPLAPPRAETVAGTAPGRVRLAGWTAANHVVFTHGDQVLRAQPRRTPEPWPNTTSADIPDTMAGDVLLVHRVGAAGAAVIERVELDGTRRPLLELASPAATSPVRCAGDRAPPCLVATTIDGTTTWYAFDLERGVRGDRVHTARDVAVVDWVLAADGKLLSYAGDTDSIATYSLDTRALEAPVDLAGGRVTALGHANRGDLWLAAADLRGRPFTLLTLPRIEQSTRPHYYTSITSRSTKDAMRIYGRAIGSPDDKSAAVVTREQRFDLWRVEGL